MKFCTVDCLTSKKFWQGALIVSLLLFCWIGLLRLLLLDVSPGVHYHADFQIYIQGQAQVLEDTSFYEEISICGDAYDNNPLSRVHLHDRIAHVIHVHDKAVTYGNFIDNIGFSLSGRVLEIRTETYVDGQNGNLRFILNGEFVRHVDRQVITSEDVLLIDFSKDSDEILLQRYQAIPPGALEANTKQDPQSCSGNDEIPSLWRRLKGAFGF